MTAASLIDVSPDILVLGGSAAIALLVWAVSTALPGPEPRSIVHRRISRVLGTPSGAKSGAQVNSVRRREKRAILRPLASRHAANMSMVQRLDQRLVAAALPIAATDLAAVVVLCNLITATALYWLMIPNAALALGAASLVTVSSTHLLIRVRSDRQAKLLSSQLPEAIDLIVRGVRSGLPVTEAMNTVAMELRPPISTTFQNVAAAVRIGKTIEQALWSEASRLPIPEMKFFIISLSIQQETGGNLADILDNLASMMRKREQLRQKIKAMSSEARASAMIIGSLPFIMAVIIYFVNADYISGLVTDTRGWLLIGAGLTSLLMGIVVMVKMIRFEI